MINIVAKQMTAYRISIRKQASSSGMARQRAMLKKSQLNGSESGSVGGI